ncbi:hypothetical protein [Mycolicibacterium komossense]|uniref:ESX-1 secretion-associated protein EspA/EspE-like domain-containing protein n=1 Tax=Mycolicibacterium komossense TaxID=1779 RepID=A0ABT3C9K3_9MYCO|nr:hypothetical protein [Mycolicibacterium komossense]MCV7226115.1 hypothetical protein [Mycolicibacterium komossense]
MTDTEISEMAADPAGITPDTVAAPLDLEDLQAVVVDTDDPDDTEEGARVALAVREVLERQLAAGQALSCELLYVASGVTAAVAEAPAVVLGAVRGGATLPAAFTQSSSVLQDVVTDAGDRIRSAIGDYISGQANLPNAVIGGTAEVTGSVVRAQGTVLSSAVDAAFTVATVAIQRGEVRDTIDQEWRELAAAAASARQSVGEKFDAARDGVRQAVAVAVAD